jgi:hypothetical protein
MCERNFWQYAKMYGRPRVLTLNLRTPLINRLFYMDTKLGTLNCGVFCREHFILREMKYEPCDRTSCALRVWAEQEADENK